ncbi:MAG: hypothetical protein VZR23_03745 [Lachnospiraceae bacterium]|jgi:hypothetical protein|nr:hypothetical protein [Lachnospiraceae bacterium]
MENENKVSELINNGAALSGPITNEEGTALSRSDGEDPLKKTAEAVNELYGLIIGISIDENINDKESDLLSEWMNKHEFLRNSNQFAIFFQMLKVIIDTRHATSEQYQDILRMLQPFASTLFTQSETAMQILKGIIKGIVGDGRLTRPELDNLYRWMNDYNEFADDPRFDKIYTLVGHILKDNVVTEDEKVQLLKKFHEFLL